LRQPIALVSALDQPTAICAEINSDVGPHRLAGTSSEPSVLRIAASPVGYHHGGSVQHLLGGLDQTDTLLVL
jgi:hypothetical protein